MSGPIYSRADRALQAIDAAPRQRQREGADLFVAIMVRKAIWKGAPGYPVFRDLARNSLRFHEFMRGRLEERIAQLVDESAAEGPLFVEAPCQPA